MFSARGRGRGSPRRQEGVLVLIENPRRGGEFSQQRGEGGGLSLGGEGGGLNFFLFGAEIPTKLIKIEFSCSFSLLLVKQRETCVLDMGLPNQVSKTPFLEETAAK